MVSAICRYVGVVLFMLAGSTAWAQSALTPAPGCNDASATDPKILDHAPARCQPGSPPPTPLSAPVTITLVTGTVTIESFAPIALGLARGEFAKENLKVEVQVIPSNDSLSLLANGKVDVQWNAPDGGFLNAVSQGFELAWVAGNFSPSPNSRSGLWARKGMTVADLRGKTISSVTGPGSVIMYPIAAALQQGGVNPTDVIVQRFDAASGIVAFRNNAVQGIWLLDPAWTQFVNDPDYTFLKGQPLGEPLGGPIFGPSLLKQNRAAGAAFIRAFVRIVNTYFAGDYKANPDFVKEMAGFIKAPPEAVANTPSNVWDWEIRAGTVERIQAATMQAKALSYTAPMPESRLVDRDFYQQAVGRRR